MKKIIITSYTDVLCSWCWATEPAYRALETRYPDEVEFRYVYGGLVRKLDDLNETGRKIDDFTPELANELLLQHWEEGVSLHHMPVQSKGFGLFTDDPESQTSFPQGLAFKAAQVSNPELANKYLRRIREATLAEALRTSERGVQVELAKEVGLDIEVFTKALDDGTADRKLQADLMLTQSQGVAVFPTFYIKTDRAREGRLTGFNMFSDFAKAITHLTDGDLRPVDAPWDEDELEYLLIKTPKLAREELFQAFDLASREELDQKINALVERSWLSKIEVGSTYFVKRIN